MKKNYKNWILATASAVAILIFVFFVSENNKSKKTPVELVKEKYAESPSYRIEKRAMEKPWTIFLGKDEENFYLDIYNEQGYFGGTEVKQENLQTLTEYAFKQEETLIIIYGIADKVAGYEMIVPGNYPATLKFERKVTDEAYVLDAYVLSDRAQITPKLTIKENR